MAAQGVIRLYKRCLGARATPQGLKHRHEVVNKAQHLALTYVEETSVLESAFASRVCSALSFLNNLGLAAITRLQDQIGPAITAGLPKEAKTNRNRICSMGGPHFGSE
eukprot:1812630-Karenia_brevis.AAC.1